MLLIGADKGVIGLDLQRSVARVYLVNWAIKFVDICNEITKNSAANININPDFFNIYVDDSLGAFRPVPKGAKFIQERQCIETFEVENEIEDEPDRRTFDILVKIANTIDSDIQMTSEVPSDYKDTTGKMPFLDTQLWIDDSDKNKFPKGKIMWSHFEKLMNSRICIQPQSAIGDRETRTIHTQEIVRILLNSHPDQATEITNNSVSNYIKKMQNSGFSEKYRLEIVKSAMKAFNKIKAEAEAGTKPMFRPRDWKRQERENLKAQQNKTWFKKGGNNNFISIPATPGSELKKDIEASVAEINKRLKMKIIEQPGRKLFDVLKMQEKKEPSV